MLKSILVGSVVLGALLVVNSKSMYDASVAREASNVAVVPVEDSVEYYEAILAESQLRRAEEYHRAWESVGFQCTNDNPCSEE